MRKLLTDKHIVALSGVLFLLVCISLILQFKTPSTSNVKAQTYSSINCPTPQAGKSALQLVPCTPSGAVNSPSDSPQQQNPVVSNPASSPAPAAGGPMAGPVCTPDSTIATGAACKCQSDLEPDAVCTVPNAGDCVENNGITGSDLMLIGSGLGGSPNSSIVSSPIDTGGSVQCLWLDSEPVPAAAQATNCSIECNSKPVLYFYSQNSLSINVSLDIPGVITASVPQYSANGWQNVIVHPEGTPDGTLLYNNELYNELYYEDATIKAQPPTQGFVIKTSDLASSLRTYTTELGLNTKEQNEFLAYWVPRLTNLGAPYIFFSVFDQTQKEKVDHVIVSPAPTTTIAFLAYFKPLAAPITVSPLQFPAVPDRLGFTMIEWGGTIDESN